MSGAVLVWLSTGEVGWGKDEFSVSTATPVISQQQGSKKVPSDIAPPSKVGQSVAISADGNMVLVGGYLDDSSNDGAWVFTRSNGEWSQEGTKLLGTGAVGAANQG